MKDIYRDQKSPEISSDDDDLNGYEQCLESILVLESDHEETLKTTEIVADAQAKIPAMQSSGTEPSTLSDPQMSSANSGSGPGKNPFSSESERDEIDELNDSKDNYHKDMDEEQCSLLLDHHLHHVRNQEQLDKKCKKCNSCRQTDNVIQNVDPSLFSLAKFKQELKQDLITEVEEESSSFGLLQVLAAYDKSFLIILFLCNFAQGFKQFLDLCLLNLYKDVLHLEPAEVTAYMGFIALPWSFKIFYGFTSDNIRIFGSKRRNHILLNTVLCSISMLCIMLFGLEFGKYFVTACVFVSQYTMAYNDTVTDALTVQASKFDVPDGCEWLNGLCYAMQGFGAIVGALMAVFVQRHPNIGPFDCFGIYLGLQMTFFVLAYFMNNKMEPGEIKDFQETQRTESTQNDQEDMERLIDSDIQNDQDRSLSCFSQLVLNFKLIWKAGKNKPIYMTVLFFIVRGLLVPTFDSTQYYFLLSQCKISQDTYDFLSIGQSIGSLLGTIIYMNFLTKYQAWKLIGFSLFLQLIHTWLLYANVVRWTVAWGFSDLTVNLVLMLFNQSLFTCLAILPMTVKMMYVIPQNIEASMFAIITACLTFSQDWGGDMLGAALADWLSITSSDMSAYPLAILIKMGLILAAFLMILVLPSDKQLKELSEKLNPPAAAGEQLEQKDESKQVQYIKKPSDAYNQE